MSNDKAHTAEYWNAQAGLALAYARARPAADMKGFFAALRDSAEFAALAKASVRQT